LELRCLTPGHLKLGSISLASTTDGGPDTAAQPLPLKRIAISQSNYIPWKGYFDLINSVDEFVLYDDMQFTRRDWRNRNQIKTAAGVQWLTIPVEVKGKFHQRINETVVSDPAWPRQHWRTLELNYARAAYFAEYRAHFEQLYLGCATASLSEINHRFLSAILNLLGSRTPLRWSSEDRLEGERSERLLNICRQAGASVYYSGPAARDYLDTALFAAAGVEVVWMDYSGYPPYRQLHGDFQHGVSILDLLFNEGPHSPSFMKSFTSRPTA
jgi:hypothetical protein